MNGASIPVPDGPPTRATALLDGAPEELAAALPPGNVVVLGGPGSGKTALLEAAMHRLLADGGTARLLTSSLQAAGTAPAVALHGGGTTSVEAARYPGPAEEAETVARLLRVAHDRDGVPYGRMAVLLPSTRRLGGPVRRALARFGIPYRLGAGERQLVAEPVVGHVLDPF